ncbi:hypothetical protein E4U44_004664 [Claviceps purpurea]|nr:hypothetical protein E4U44_004664 [Claviceps purpurea]
MADQIQELVDTPSQFLKDGVQFMNKCQKRMRAPPSTLLDHGPFATAKLITCALTADQKEFTKICQAVGTGFVVMGVVGYVVKLIHIPINQILVGGA